MPALNYRGRFSRWRDFLEDLVKQEEVTDIIYYGDRKPYHRIAVEVAKKLDETEEEIINYEDSNKVVEMSKRIIVNSNTPHPPLNS